MQANPAGSKCTKTDSDRNETLRRTQATASPAVWAETTRSTASGPTMSSRAATIALPTIKAGTGALKTSAAGTGAATHPGDSAPDSPGCYVPAICALATATIVFPLGTTLRLRRPEHLYPLPAPASVVAGLLVVLAISGSWRKKERYPCRFLLCQRVRLATAGLLARMAPRSRDADTPL